MSIYGGWAKMSFKFGFGREKWQRAQNRPVKNSKASNCLPRTPEGMALVQGPAGVGWQPSFTGIKCEQWRERGWLIFMQCLWTMLKIFNWILLLLGGQSVYWAQYHRGDLTLSFSAMAWEEEFCIVIVHVNLFVRIGGWFPEIGFIRVNVELLTEFTL